MTDRIVVIRQPTIVRIAAPGPQGLAGAAGYAETVRAPALLANAALSGHRAVRPRSDSAAEYADAATLSHLQGPFWVTTAAVAEDTPIVATAYGSVTEPSWAWTPGAAVFLGLAGLLTQTPPTAPDAVFSLVVGVAQTATTLFVDPRPPIVL